MKVLILLCAWIVSMIAFMNARSIPIKERFFWLFYSVAVVAGAFLCFKWHMVPPFLYLALLLFAILGGICHIKAKRKWKIVFFKNISILFSLLLIVIAMAQWVDDIRWICFGAFFPAIYCVLWIKCLLFEWKTLTPVYIMSLASLPCAVLIVCGAHTGLVLAYILCLTSFLLLLSNETINEFLLGERK